MVGVPGRSKGCSTCRKRRVKCDEAKPFCHRCTKAGFECLGYNRPVQWRHTSTAPFPSTQCEGNEISGPVRAAVMARCSAPPKELSFVAFEDNICFAHLFQNFVWRSYGTLWLDRAARGDLGNLSLEATKALSHYSFGRSNRRHGIEVKGAIQYGKCLRVLASELGNIQALAQRGRNLVVPILALLMYSSLQSDRAAAVFHLKGIAKMLYVCGPETFQQQPLRNAFDAARATLLVASIFSKQQMFLEDPQWQTAPWALDPASKSPQSYLLDILVTIPGLLEENGRLEQWRRNEVDELIDPTLILDDNSLRRSELCDRVATQLEKLYRWRWDWQQKHGHQVRAKKDGTVCRNLGSMGRSRQLDKLSFDRPVHANDIMLYNAALMWLLSLLWKLEPLQSWTIIEGCARRATPSSSSSASCIRSGSSGEPSFEPMPGNMRNLSFAPLRRPGASVSIRDPAMEICRVYEWQSRNHDRCTTSEDQTCLYLFPVGMARSVLDAEPEGKAWIQEMLDTSPATSGYGTVGDNVAGFGFYVTKAALDPDIVLVDIEIGEAWADGVTV